MHILIQHLHLHFRAVTLRCGKRKILYTQRVKPIKNNERDKDKPEDGSYIKHGVVNRKDTDVFTNSARKEGMVTNDLCVKGDNKGDGEILVIPLKRSHSYRGVTFSACGPFCP
jgi:hypothetical protein